VFPSDMSGPPKRKRNSLTAKQKVADAERKRVKRAEQKALFAIDDVNSKSQGGGALRERKAREYQTRKKAKLQVPLR
jgi:hypothetical protein